MAPWAPQPVKGEGNEIGRGAGASLDPDPVFPTQRCMFPQHADAPLRSGQTVPVAHKGFVAGGQPLARTASINAMNMG